MSNKIELAKGYSAYRDQHGWTLVQTYETKDKKGNPIEKDYKTYYASLAQCCAAVADRKAGECPNSKAVMEMWKEFLGQIRDVTRGVQ